MSTTSAPIPRLPLPSTGNLTPPLRTQIHQILLSTNAISTIHLALLQECQSSGWLEAIRRRALELLRSGECGSFEEVMDAVLREARGKNVNGVISNGTAVEEKTNVKIPETVTAEGVKIVKGVLEEMLDVGEE
ncbi:MAG: hypothetical protein MMC33_004711 [Icmadophila ericetorum]|nr:hypothetical protein [Icmadophila ericetorum]